jgi:hypothetical protein
MSLNMVEPMQLSVPRPKIRLPSPFAHFWAQTGAIISLGNGLIAAFVGAIAYGFVGIIGVIAAFAVVAALELIRYSVRMEDERDRATGDRDGLETQLGRARANVLELERDRGELSRTLAVLRAHIESTDPTLERTLATLMQASAAASFVLRHRVLAAEHLDGWPVVGFALDHEGNVVIAVRISGADASEIAKEPMALHCPDMAPIDMRGATGAEEELRATCLIEDLPPALSDDLMTYGAINPPGCRLNLRGMSVGVYPRLSSETIEVVDASLKLAGEALGRAIDEAQAQGGSG